MKLTLLLVLIYQGVIERPSTGFSEPSEPQWNIQKKVVSFIVILYHREVFFLKYIDPLK
jgi:hypothetical protein